MSKTMYFDTDTLRAVKKSDYINGFKKWYYSLIVECEKGGDDGE